MKSVKWMYVSAMAIAFGMLSFATVACHDDDDDPKPAEGEVIETPKPVVEYYIKGAVTVKGEGKSGVKVKVGDKDCITDSKGEFSVTESLCEVSLHLSRIWGRRGCLMKIISCIAMICISLINKILSNFI